MIAIAGLAIGLGTALGNGCTSGHGLCGLSRFSLRSLAAVPTFMAVAGGVASARSGFVVGAPLPIGNTPPEVLALSLKLAVALLGTLMPIPALLASKSMLREIFVGLWTGVTFAVGLSIGGMVRPSTISGALTPAAFDGTLWVLFMTALVTTFIMYRVAQAFGVAEATVGRSGGGKVDSKLIAGAALFGLGWGIAGMCPGPHIVTIGANPFAATPALMLAFVGIGMWLAQPVGDALFS